MRELPITATLFARKPTAWFAAFAIGGDAQRRITYIALAVLLQSIIEMPREIIASVFGPTTTGVIIVLLAISLGLLIYAVVAPKSTPTLSSREQRWTRMVLYALLGIGLTFGTYQVATMVGASFSHQSYPNDGTTLDHYAAVLLLEGKNPYQASNIAAAVAYLHQAGEFTTPLRAGQFAGRDWRNYPTKAQSNALIAQAQTHLNTAPAEFESKVSYPAFSFLLLVPFVWFGLPSVVLSTVLCYLLLAFVSWRAVASQYRPWLLLLLIADIPVIEAVAIGEPDIIVMLLVLLAWLWYDRPIAGTIALGLAISTKQQAWFYALFLAIFLIHRLGWRSALTRLAGATAIFVAINAPFILQDHSAWLAGIAAPISDPMFPLGGGLVGLSLGHYPLLPLLPQRVYTALELLALCGALGWYATIGVRRYPATGIVLAMVPLWFNWRSLPTYFFFCALPLFIVWLVIKPQSTEHVSSSMTADVSEINLGKEY